ncbi:hypothetical protein Cgig2_032652 [Carnegiea gigantea]|uniref:Uncharacterized protein n=1 Tax=Carnegiea gigantea TaxID=171969 RepID=A0A9Q1GTL2_9CARY|nr:hypothetical protein Cgig2_032652 [Carnegiea gigantea]
MVCFATFLYSPWYDSLLGASCTGSILKYLSLVFILMLFTRTSKTVLAKLHVTTIAGDCAACWLLAAGYSMGKEVENRFLSLLVASFFRRTLVYALIFLVLSLCQLVHPFLPLTLSSLNNLPNNSKWSQGTVDVGDVMAALDYLGRSQGLQRAKDLAAEHASLAAKAIDSLPPNDDEEVRRSRRALTDLTHIVVSRTK